MVVGVLLGLVVGVFPGLGGIVGLSLLIPFLYGMDAVSALAMLVGLVAVIPTSDTFTSVLMGIPGSSASQATVLDGFPLAKKGEAARALGAAFSASLFGGLFGAVILTFFVLIAKPVILFFTSAELFMLAVLGISMVGVLSGRNLWKGVASCGLGLVIGTVGGAPATGEWRMTLGIDYLADGIPLVVIGLGIFAFPEVIDLLRRSGTIAGGAALGRGWLDGLRDMIRNRWLCLRCAGIGTLIGAIPGLGGSVVDWIAYGHVVQTARDKSQFGAGDIRGVLAPESANNAKEGGGLIPTLLFGIPGSGSMAVFIGGLVLIGLEPGPRLLTAELPTTYTIVWTLALANVVGAGLCLFLSPAIARLTTIRYHLLAPFMLMVISFAAFQASRDLMDFVFLIAVGFLGVGMKRFGWSRPALLIGFVLADQAETYLYQAIQFHEWGFLTRPGVLAIAAIIVVSVILGARSKPQPKDADNAPAVHAAALAPQLLFAGFVALVFALGALRFGAAQHARRGVSHGRSGRDAGRERLRPRRHPPERRPRDDLQPRRGTARHRVLRPAREGNLVLPRPGDRPDAADRAHRVLHRAQRVLHRVPAARGEGHVAAHDPAHAGGGRDPDVPVVADDARPPLGAAAASRRRSSLADRFDLSRSAPPGRHPPVVAKFPFSLY